MNQQEFIEKVRVEFEKVDSRLMTKQSFKGHEFWLSINQKGEYDSTQMEMCWRGYLARAQRDREGIEFLKKCNENQRAYFDECEKLRNELAHAKEEIESFNEIVSRKIQQQATLRRVNDFIKEQLQQLKIDRDSWRTKYEIIHLDSKVWDCLKSQEELRKRDKLLDWARSFIDDYNILTDGNNLEVDKWNKDYEELLK